MAPQAASAVGRLRAAINEFLDSVGDDPKYADVAKEARQLDHNVSSVAAARDATETPGRLAAGEAPAAHEQQDQFSPGARASAQAGGHPMDRSPLAHLPGVSLSPGQQAADRAAPTGAKGGQQPPQKRRAKSRATAQKGSY